MVELEIVAAGGLGDIVLAGFYPNSPLGKLPDYRSKRLQDPVTLRMITTSPQAAAALHKFDPLINRITAIQFDDKRHADLPIQDPLEGYTWTRRPVFLAPDEALPEIVQSPFVCIHPFAGLPERDWLANDLGHWMGKIVAAVASQGLGVIILGGNHNRDGKEHTEAYTGSGALSLVNQGIRVQMACLQSPNCLAFLGSMSCFNCMAACEVLPTWVIVPTSQSHHFMENKHNIHGGIFFIMPQQGSRISYFDKLPSVYEITKWVDDCRQNRNERIESLPS